MIRTVLLVGLLLPACPGGTVVEPDRPVPPVVVEPEAKDASTPPPVLTPCERAAAHAAEMGCTTNASGWAAACQRYEDEAARAPALAWHPECQVKQANCAGIERCRGGQ